MPIRTKKELKEELQLSLNWIEQLSNSILRESEQWKEEPEYFFMHGYATEKAEKLLLEIQQQTRRIKTFKGGE